MESSINTDYLRNAGDPSPYLRRIADSGFTHIHWCHHWNTDFLYVHSEIEQIGKWLKEYNLRLLDLHGSKGIEKDWTSSVEYERKAGVELVKNRILITAKLQADVVVMHHSADSQLDAVRKSLDDLMPYAKERNVRIALENGNFQIISQLLSEYEPEFLGFCYDSGHANLCANAFEYLNSMKSRLIAIHLNDNDGVDMSLHGLPFSGTVDWKRLISLLACSSYRKCLNMEVNMSKSGIEDEAVFLTKAFEMGQKLTAMVIDEYRRL